MKRLLEQYGAGGVAHLSERVCARCFEDEGIRNFIREAASEKRCSFCGARSRRPIAAPLVEVAEYIKECLETEYGFAAEHLPYESAEGGYLGEHWTTYEVLFHEVGLELPNDDGRLSGALVDAVGDDVWCEADPFGLRRDQQLLMSWESFCEVIKHDRRFFFWQDRRRRKDRRRHRDELLDPAEVLTQLGGLCRDLHLFTTLETGTRIFRVRLQRPGDTLRTAGDLGPPPPQYAIQSNRMSPPGIPLFYGAADRETAVREMLELTGTHTYVVGTFEIRKEVTLLDLTRVPPVPGLFEGAEPRLRHGLAFLNGFVRDVSKPIARDDRVHIEYLPTQVVTEYFRYAFRYERKHLDGIIYPSAKVPGRRCLALFAGQETLIGDAAESDDGHLGLRWRRSRPWLRLVARRERIVTSNEGNPVAAQNQTSPSPAAH